MLTDITNILRSAIGAGSSERSQKPRAGFLHALLSSLALNHSDRASIPVSKADEGTRGESSPPTPDGEQVSNEEALEHDVTSEVNAADPTKVSLPFAVTPEPDDATVPWAVDRTARHGSRDADQSRQPERSEQFEPELESRPSANGDRPPATATRTDSAPTWRTFRTFGDPSNSSDDDTIARSESGRQKGTPAAPRQGRGLLSPDVPQPAPQRPDRRQSVSTTSAGNFSRLRRAASGLALADTNTNPEVRQDLAQNSSRPVSELESLNIALRMGSSAERADFDAAPRRPAAIFSNDINQKRADVTLPRERSGSSLPPGSAAAILTTTEFDPGSGDKPAATSHVAAGPGKRLDDAAIRATVLRVEVAAQDSPISLTTTLDWARLRASSRLSPVTVSESAGPMPAATTSTVRAAATAAAMVNTAPGAALNARTLPPEQPTKTTPTQTPAQSATQSLEQPTTVPATARATKPATEPATKPATQPAPTWAMPSEGQLPESVNLQAQSLARTIAPGASVADPEVAADGEAAPTNRHGRLATTTAENRVDETPSREPYADDGQRATSNRSESGNVTERTQVRPLQVPARDERAKSKGPEERPAEASKPQATPEGASANDDNVAGSTRLDPFPRAIRPAGNASAISEPRPIEADAKVAQATGRLLTSEGADGPAEPAPGIWRPINGADGEGHGSSNSLLRALSDEIGAKSVADPQRIRTGVETVRRSSGVSHAQRQVGADKASGRDQHTSTGPANARTASGADVARYAPAAPTTVAGDPAAETQASRTTEAAVETAMARSSDLSSVVSSRASSRASYSVSAIPSEVRSEKANSGTATTPLKVDRNPATDGFVRVPAGELPATADAPASDIPVATDIEAESRVLNVLDATTHSGRTNESANTTGRSATSSNAAVVGDPKPGRNGTRQNSSDTDGQTPRKDRMANGRQQSDLTYARVEDTDLVESYAPVSERMNAPAIVSRTDTLAASIAETIDSLFASESAVMTAERPDVQSASHRTATATAAREARPGGTWYRPSAGVRLPDGQGFTRTPGWHAIEMNLEDGDGSLLIRAKRENDVTRITLEFTDPAIKHQAEQNIAKLRSVLAERYDTEIDLNLGGRQSDGSRHGDARQTETMHASGSNSSAPSGDPRPIGADDVELRPTADSNEWIG